jgi:hypothetical protein
MSTPIFHGTREEWIELLIAHWTPHLLDMGIAPVNPGNTIRVAMAPLSSKLLGVCHPSSASVCGTVNLVTVCTKQAAPIELAHTALHEHLHALDDCRSGHKGRWKRWADQIGIQSRGHERGPIAQYLLTAAIDAVGLPAQHTPSVSAAPKPPSQIKLTCAGCRLSVWMARAAVQEGRKVVCSVCAVELQP